MMTSDLLRTRQNNLHGSGNNVSVSLNFVRYEFRNFCLTTLKKRNILNIGIIIKIMSSAAFDNRNTVAIVKCST